MCLSRCRKSVVVGVVLACLLSVPSGPSAEQVRIRVLPEAAFWVDDNGAAAWSACFGFIPLSGASACSLATANSNVAAGNTVYLRGGTYNTPIKPTAGVSGTLGARITIQGYPGETATLTSVGATQPGIELENNDYFRLFRFTVTSVYQLAFIHGGSSFNEFAFLTIHTGTGPANSGFNIFTIGADDSTANVHNWLHDFTLSFGGQINSPPPMGAGCDDSGGLFNLGADGVNDGVSNFTTIENMVVFAGAHHALKVNTRFNVIRNNFVHNEGAYFVATPECQAAVDGAGNLCAPDGFYGNRAITVLNNHTTVPAWFTDTWNLIERNRTGPGGLPSDGNGADSLTLGGKRDIARFNAIYGGLENGLLFRSSGNIAHDHRVYNNTIYANGGGPACRLPPANPGFVISGIRITGGSDDNVVINNLLWNNPAGAAEIRDSGAGNTISNNWRQANGDPLFVNGSLADYASPTIPDFSLQAGSGAINNGTHLTTANGAGAATTTLVVEDSTFFQYGERGSDLVRLAGTMYADEIAIGTVTNTVRIVSIDYTTHTITLASAKTWSDDAPIWLTRDSSNTVVLLGSAPDQGAFEKQ